MFYSKEQIQKYAAKYQEEGASLDAATVALAVSTHCSVKDLGVTSDSEVLMYFDVGGDEYLAELTIEGEDVIIKHAVNSAHGLIVEHICTMGFTDFFRYLNTLPNMSMFAKFGDDDTDKKVARQVFMSYLQNESGVRDFD